MQRSARIRDNLAALPLVAPFVIVYAALFIYPSLQMLVMSFTDSALTKVGEWVGMDNFTKLFTDRISAQLSSTPYISWL